MAMDGMIPLMAECWSSLLCSFIRHANGKSAANHRSCVQKCSKH